MPKSAEEIGQQLAGKVIPAAVIFADDETHVADLRRRAAEHIAAAIREDRAEMEAALASLQERYDCNTAIMHARTKALTSERQRRKEAEALLRPFTKQQTVSEIVSSCLKAVAYFKKYIHVQEQP